MTPEVFRRITEALFEDVFTALPGIVRSYDADTQKAVVQPALQQGTRAVDDDEPDLVESLPLLSGVPVVHIRGGGMFVHLPLVAGDTVLLVCCQQDLNAWMRDGGEVDPGTMERHGLSGAVAIPGLYPSTEPLAGMSASVGMMGTEGGPQVEFHPAEVRAGGSAALAMAAATDAHLAAISAALTTMAAGIPGVENSYIKTTVDGAFPVGSLVLKGS